MIDRYKILNYWEESKDDDGKYVLFTDHQKQIDELKSKIERLEELPKRARRWMSE